MDWKLEVVPIPVSDVDSAKRFYSEQVGFAVDLDTHIGEGMRLVRADSARLGLLDPPERRDPEHGAGSAGGLAAGRL